jgi:hypothetical protein
LNGSNRNRCDPFRVGRNVEALFVAMCDPFGVKFCYGNDRYKGMLNDFDIHLKARFCLNGSNRNRCDPFRVGRNVEALFVAMCDPFWVNVCYGNDRYKGLLNNFDIPFEDTVLFE